MRIESELGRSRLSVLVAAERAALDEARSVAVGRPEGEPRDTTLELAVLAHDLNNLLNVVLAANEALAAGLQEGSRSQELAQLSQAAAERGAVLVRRLLDPRAAAMRPDPVDAAEALHATSRRVRVMSSAGIAIEISAATPLFCAVDRSDLESALLNLCVNALQAMPSGGRLRVAAERVRLSPEEVADLALTGGDQVMISVSDTGAGMSPQTLSQATAARFSTRRDRGGSGLGLSGVDALARKAGGRLRLASALGLGTTARLYLPAA